MGVLEAIRDALSESEEYMTKRELEFGKIKLDPRYPHYLRAGNALRGDIAILNRRLEGGSAEDELEFWKMAYGLERAANKRLRERLQITEREGTPWDVPK